MRTHKFLILVVLLALVLGACTPVATEVPTEVVTSSDKVVTRRLGWLQSSYGCSTEAAAWALPISDHRQLGERWAMAPGCRQVWLAPTTSTG